LALLAVAAVGVLALFPVRDLPTPEGPRAVGTRSFEIVDTSRLGVFAARPDQPRKMVVRVWYPAAATEGLETCPYFTDIEACTTATGLGSLFGFPPFFSYIKHVGTNSYENAPLLSGARNLPTVLYSHGYVSFLAQNTALMEHLASHGYVVFSLQHTFDSSPTVFADGEVAPLDPAISANAVGGRARPTPNAPQSSNASRQCGNTCPPSPQHTLNRSRKPAASETLGLSASSGSEADEEQWPPGVLATQPLRWTIDG
jgi:predicted dienelactone hydrolase